MSSPSLDLDVRRFDGDDEHIASCIYALLRVVLVNPRVDEDIPRQLSKEIVWSPLLLKGSMDINVLPFVKGLPSLPRPTLGSNLHEYISVLVERLPDAARELFTSRIATYKICDSCGYTGEDGEKTLTSFTVSEDLYALSPKTGSRRASGIGIDDPNAFVKTLDTSWVPTKEEKPGNCPNCGHPLRRQSLRLVTPNILIFNLDETFLGEIPREFTIPGHPSSEARLRLVISHPSKKSQATGLTPRATVFIASMSNPGAFELIDTDNTQPVSKAQNRIKKILATGRGFDSGYDDIPSVVIYEVDPVSKIQPLVLTGPPSTPFPNQQKPMEITDLDKKPQQEETDYSYDDSYSYPYSYSYSYSSTEKKEPSATIKINPYGTQIKTPMPAQSSYNVTLNPELNGAGYEKTSTTSNCCIIWTRIHPWWKAIIICLLPILLILIFVLIALIMIIRNKGKAENPVIDALVTRRLIVGSPEDTSASSYNNNSNNGYKVVTNDDLTNPIMKIWGNTEFNYVVTTHTTIDRGTGLNNFSSDDLEPDEDFTPTRIIFDQLSFNDLTVTDISASKASLQIGTLTVESTFNITSCKAINNLNATNIDTAILEVIGGINPTNFYAEPSSPVTFDSEVLSVMDLISEYNISADDTYITTLNGPTSGTGITSDIVHLTGNFVRDTAIHTYNRLRYQNVLPVEASNFYGNILYVVGSVSLGSPSFSELNANVVNIGLLNSDNFKKLENGNLVINELIVSDNMELGGITAKQNENVVIEPYVSTTNISSRGNLTAESNVYVGSTSQNSNMDINSYTFTSDTIIADNADVSITDFMSVDSITVENTLDIIGTFDVTGTTTVELPSFDKAELDINKVNQRFTINNGAILNMDLFNTTNTGVIGSLTFNGDTKLVSVEKTSSWVPGVKLSSLRFTDSSGSTAFFEGAEAKDSSSSLSTTSVVYHGYDEQTCESIICVTKLVEADVNTFELSKTSDQDRTLDVTKVFNNCGSSSSGNVSKEINIKSDYIQTLITPSATIEEGATLAVGTITSGTVNNFYVSHEGNSGSTEDIKANPSVKITGNVTANTLNYGKELNVSNITVTTSLIISNNIDGNVILDSNFRVNAKAFGSPYALVSGGSGITRPLGVCDILTNSNDCNSQYKNDYKGNLITKGYYAGTSSNETTNNYS